MNIVEKWEQKKQNIITLWEEAIVCNNEKQIRRCKEQVALINEFLSDLKV